MPNRIIKESICYSESIKGLSWFEEAFFYRLIVNADDYGRFDGRPEMLQARLFPLRRDITDKAVEKALNALTTAGMVQTYVYDGNPFLQLTAWERHQQMRAKKSKYPNPEESDIICNQMQSNVPVIQSESESESESFTRANFDEFWSAYPKKKSKNDALKAFNAIAPGKELFTVMLEAIASQKASHDWQKEDGKYIPYPATWLRAGAWEDEVDSQSSPKNGDKDDMGRIFYNGKWVEV